ncbi:nitric oxide reductase F protein [Roseovarius dicentrarchi]|uniref:nitric oxide reductase F protein n=1 Tax=Roseovarius dicentrarchi TaxID=2250573 RepID=UPI000DEACD52|nr:nitric oxide reductase F protein [Roseovarius dicentrarchi]
MSAARPDTLARAWLALIGLSGLSAVVAAAIGHGFDGRVAGGIVLLLALLKARIILSAYLGLSAAPAWRRGFNAVLGAYMLVALGLYLLPAL